MSTNAFNQLCHEELRAEEQAEIARDERDRYIAWSGNPSTSTYAEVIASEQREHIQTEAYAAGRADEREEWKPVLEALRWIRGYTSVRHTYTDCAIHSRAEAAIAKATGEEA
jgi:hypothetical protein